MNLNSHRFTNCKPHLPKKNNIKNFTRVVITLQNIFHELFFVYYIKEATSTQIQTFILSINLMED